MKTAVTHGAVVSALKTVLKVTQIRRSFALKLSFERYEMNWRIYQVGQKDRFLNLNVSNAGQPSVDAKRKARA